jgi:hypothetical protein
MNDLPLCLFFGGKLVIFSYERTIAKQISSANCVNQSSPLFIGLVPTALLALSWRICVKPWKISQYGSKSAVSKPTIGNSLNGMNLA